MTSNQIVSVLHDLRRFLLGSRLNVLLIFVPISLVAGASRVSGAWVFILSCLAIIPLAGLIGQATEATAERTGPALGGLLNATFGNATELIIALFALHSGLFSVVKASISGSILGNLLLVLGASLFAGGWGRDRQRFSRTAASASVSMLMLAVTALVMPAVWSIVVGPSAGVHGVQVHRLSLFASIVLLGMYAASLVFSLVTHRDVMGGASPGGEEDSRKAVEGEPAFGLPSSVVLLLAATVLTAVESEMLVHAIESAATGLGLTELFIGVVIVAVIGNAAEHYSAVAVAAKGQMNLSLNIALGSSTQIALFVAPVLVLASYAFGRPMDLVFGPFELTALALAVLNVALTCLDGEATWFEGVQLMAVYLILSLAFYFVPAQGHP